jgi:tRNA-dihydrouridine synthase
MSNFWREQLEKNPRGLVVLAPMADVTDNPFRRILSDIGAPDVYWNEFVSADGLVHPQGRVKLERMLSFEEDQRPIAAQIFSGDADNCREAARICAEHGFDAIDINMGCPARNIIKQVSGSELSKVEHRDRVARIIEETRKGAGDVPVSVKSRLGFNEIDYSWILFLLNHELPLLTLHLRTKKEMSKVPAHWELVDAIVEMRDKIAPDTILIMNGDIADRAQSYELCKTHGIDGVMIGRGVLQDITAFAPTDLGAKHPSVGERVELALRHTRYFIEEYTIDGELTKNFNLMKKFYKVYIQGFDGAKELRTQLMTAQNYEEIEEICTTFLSDA